MNPIRLSDYPKILKNRHLYITMDASSMLLLWVTSLVTSSPDHGKFHPQQVVILPTQIGI
jgi:hypothetical protein